ncbi:bifunctional diaminohydroxyphosphoribosylaminopyrimidine deaminase/5-amino-6-(5-phosphoribosylamino)uracil reductase RibD [Tepidimonas sp.]|uniref:bifunctional diaminohydroxyphosphoribosylaminopyrimidine deaminase/5-amino-6-(5-phosphoribosylamino)uracil reductase RibD n=1 Tax=Tepidimonas sp. TaxID=2002775 RepID=UPI0028CCE1AF|nr:bifunctional diaminohydroxyphosphoribosylaminopyrimidine deaminase/5-amino-6-(5-phosphoribosylamino)uracil reductase RibD [Tepidimonas sp.]MDT7929172.1 bifunctional diaminohydroxyphosphoribosylaminopyrimidine deaminase/5-amino-6-(5-phosphoribosylamino)uracil reductase RibD [Tepidimonas sp.]
MTTPDPLDAHAWEGLLPLAEQAIGLSDPNPRVACRLLLRDGRVFEGHTQAAGQAHAEVMALRAAQAAGADVRGATAFVTLEPCSHHGRTPPCCDALIAAGVAHVVVANEDPNPRVSGQGLARLRQAGVQVTVLPPDHPVALATRELNIGFWQRMRHGRPWVRMKVAASLDGVTALPNGVSQWITSPEARTDGHAWRRRAGAVLTGIGTVRQDDPRLDVRLVPTARQPLRVVLDSALEIDPDARILQPPGEVLLYTASDPAATARQRAALQALGVTIIDRPGPPKAPGGPPKVDLAAVLADLAAREVNELHIEAGAALNASWWRAGLVDELLLYLAPRLLGQGLGLTTLGPLDRLDDGCALAFVAVDPVGPDLRVRARVPGRTPF